MYIVIFIHELCDKKNYHCQIDFELYLTYKKDFKYRLSIFTDDKILKCVDHATEFRWIIKIL